MSKGMPFTANIHHSLTIQDFVVALFLTLVINRLEGT